MRGDGLRASQDGKAPGLQLRPRGNYDNPGKIQNAKTGKKKKTTQINHKTYCGISPLKKLYISKTSRNTISIYHFAFKDLSKIFQCFCGELSFSLFTHPILCSDLVVYNQL